MTPVISLPQRDRLLVGLAFLAGALALPWLPGPYLPASAAITAAVAFLLPVTALSMCVGRSVLTGRTPAEDEVAGASSQAVAAATTALCSFTVSLHLLVLTMLTGAPLDASTAARMAVVLFGLHLAAVGNVLPRLRPGWPADGSVQDSRDQAWIRTYRMAGTLGVACGLAIAFAGTALGGRQIDTLLKIGLVTTAICIAWSLRRVRAN